MEAAESALRHKAVEMALCGDAGMMRYCLGELSAQRLRSSGFMLPELTTIENLPKATYVILQAAAVGTITFQEANELAKLVGVHAEAMRDEELSRRISLLEEQQGW